MAGISVSKSLTYAVIGPSPGIDVSKTAAYAVMIPFVLGTSITKTIAYAVIYPSATIVQPGTASLTIAGKAPTLKFTITLRPATRALHINAFPPTVTATGNYKALPQPAHLSITAFQPFVYIAEPAVPPAHDIFAPGAQPGAGDIYRLDQLPDGGDIYRLDQPPGGGSIYKK